MVIRVNLKVDHANNKADDSYQFTALVGSYLAGASPYGALDMAGNVWDWAVDLDFYQIIA